MAHPFPKQHVRQEPHIPNRTLQFISRAVQCSDIVAGSVGILEGQSLAKALLLSFGIYICCDLNLCGRTNHSVAFLLWPQQDLSRQRVDIADQRRGKFSRFCLKRWGSSDKLYENQKKIFPVTGEALTPHCRHMFQCVHWQPQHVVTQFWISTRAGGSPSDAYHLPLKQGLRGLCVMVCWRVLRDSVRGESTRFSQHYFFPVVTLCM